MDGLEGDLAAYYDQEAGLRAVRDLGPCRTTGRDEFLALLRAEGRRTLLEVGTGLARGRHADLAPGWQILPTGLAWMHGHDEHLLAGLAQGIRG